MADNCRLESRLLPGSLLDLEALFIGEHLGSGSFRSVYAHNLDKKLVFKVETHESMFHNIREWEAWNDLRWNKGACRWLAPCHFISRTGAVLIQARTTPITKAQMPRRVPRFLADIKPDNWGTYQGRVVCHDYALLLPKYELKRKAAT